MNREPGNKRAPEISYHLSFPVESAWPKGLEGSPKGRLRAPAFWSGEDPTRGDYRPGRCEHQSSGKMGSLPLPGAGRRWLAITKTATSRACHGSASGSTWVIRARRGAPWSSKAAMVRLR